MKTLKDLSLGTKLVLSAGPLLFLGLFFTWQTLRIDYGRAGVAEQPQDGWDVWGLLIAVLVIALVTLVTLERLTEVDMSEEIPWAAITLALGTSIFAITVLKNLTDDYSTIASYVFVALSGALAAGAYLVWGETRARDPYLVSHEDRGVSSTT
jgi:hypothetical protein